jgi:hypothetical protein
MVFPTLFQNWGALAPAAGFLWFGLLFFAAITSSLAMGQPIMAFLQTEFRFSRPASALAFGAMLIPLAFPVACITQKSFFDEFDYWAGTFSLVLLAVIETILFAWVFGMARGWEEMNRGGEIRVPGIFYYITQYVTPVFLIFILLAYAFQPAAGWDAYFRALTQGSELPAWDWAGDGMIGKLLNRDLITPANATPEERDYLGGLRWLRAADRLVMVGTFAFFAVLVHIAWRRRTAEGRLHK